MYDGTCEYRVRASFVVLCAEGPCLLGDEDMRLGSMRWGRALLRAARYRTALRQIGFLLLLVGLFVMSGCSASSAQVHATPSPKATATPRDPGPQTTDSSLLYPRHYQGKRVLTLTDFLNQMISHMSLDEEVGQLLIAQFNDATFSSQDAAMIRKLHAGGLILYAISIKKANQTRSLINAAQGQAKIPLFVMADEEGGFVDRMTSIYGGRPSASDIGATNSTSYARSQGAKVGRDMGALGFNMDLAPDVDVQLVAGPDQRTRTFGTTPDQVTRMAGAWLNGLQSQGVVGTLKHFPGLGGADHDAHLRLPVIKRSRAQIEAVELAPYRALIDSGKVQAIMPTDLLMPAIDPKLPAELSPTIMTGILRRELGFNGVVITDALYMAGIREKWDMGQAAVMAIQAGDDMLLGASSVGAMQAIAKALKNAVKSHRLTKSRLDESVRRILMLKIRMGLIKQPKWAASTMVPAAPAGSTLTLVESEADTSRP
jgi:beta-N-acetylhexosaminidase